MSDTKLNQFLASGTNAERLLFTPSPPSVAAAPCPGSVWFETDTGDTYAWDDGGGVWVQVNTAGGAAPDSAEYLVAALSGSLSAERVPTDTATVAWDFGTAAQAKANVPDDAITFAKQANIATDSLVGRDTAGSGDPENILLNATLSMDGSGNLQRAALTGDVTAPAGSNATTIANLAVTTGKLADDAVTYAKLQNVSATDRLLGRDTAGAGDAEELTVGGGVEFTGSGGIQRSALTGDVTAAAGNNATTIANDAVTFAKMQNVATDRLIGRDTAGSGDPEEVSLSTGLEWSGSQSVRVTTAQRTRQITVTIDGGGSALTTGAKKVYLRVPVACTIVGSYLVADQSGSIVLDVWKDSYANFPPTVADTITASAKPTLSTAQKSSDTTLTGWTTALAAGDFLEWNVDSVTTCTKVTHTLEVTVP